MLIVRYIGKCNYVKVYNGFWLNKINEKIENY